MLVLPTNPSPTKTKRMMLSVELVLLVTRVLVTFFYFDDFVIFKIFLLTFEFLRYLKFWNFFWGLSIPFRRWILHFIFTFSFFYFFVVSQNTIEDDEYRFIRTFKLMCTAKTREYKLSTGLYRLISYPTGTESRFPSLSCQEIIIRV